MAPQSKDDKVPSHHKPTVMQKFMELYFVNRNPKFVKRIADAKQRPAPPLNPEIKVNVDQPVRRGRRLMLSGSSGNVKIASSVVVRCSRREAILNTLKMRHDLGCHRYILHIVNLIVHIVNLSSLHEAAESITNPDPKVAKFLAMRFRYFTTWVVMLHIFYSASALTLEAYREIKIGPNPYQPVKFQKFSAEGLFRNIIWPYTLVVTIFFWTLFIYNRELIFPEFVDQVISPTSNHVLHTWIAIFVFLEVLVRPRIRPATVAPNLRTMFTVLAVYLFVFYYTLFSEDIWLYPVFSVAYKSGILAFLALHLLLLTLFVLSYAFLWKVNDYFHKQRQFVKKHTQSFRIRWGSAADK